MRSGFDSQIWRLMWVEFVGSLLFSGRFLSGYSGFPEIEPFSIECRKYLTNCFGFALLHSVIGSKFSCHFFNQSEVKPKPIVAGACTFSCALCRLRVITLSFDCFTGLSPSFLIGQSNYFGFGFMTLD